MLLLIIIAQYYCIYQLSMVPSRKKKLRCCVFVFLFFSLCFFFFPDMHNIQHKSTISQPTKTHITNSCSMIHGLQPEHRPTISQTGEREREEGMKKKRENELKKNVFLCLPSGLKKIIF